MSTQPLYDSPAAALAAAPILQKQSSSFRPSDPVAYCAVAAALIKTAYELQGEPHHPNIRLYQSLQKVADQAGAIQLAQVVYQSLGKVRRTQEAIEKLATAGPGGLASAWAGLQSLWSGAKTVPGSALKTIGFLGTVAGGGAGAGAWALSRSLNKEDQQLRELEIQRDTYRKLTAEVEAELQRRKLKNTPANRAAAVDYLT